MARRNAKKKFTQEEVEKKIQKAKNLLLLTRRYDVSEKLIEKYLDKWDHNCWCFLSSNKMSESFIERHKDKVQWIVICMKQKMSYDFVIKHFDKIEPHIKHLKENKKLKQEDFEPLYVMYELIK